MVFQGWFTIAGTRLTDKGSLVMRPKLKTVHLELARRFGSFHPHGELYDTINHELEELIRVMDQASCLLRKNRTP